MSKIKWNPIMNCTRFWKMLLNTILSCLPQYRKKYSLNLNIGNVYEATFKNTYSFLGKLKKLIHNFLSC